MLKEKLKMMNGVLENGNYQLGQFQFGELRKSDNIILGLISYKIPIYWEVTENEKSKVMEVLYERERKNYPIMV